jgi:hypothetical protein
MTLIYFIVMAATSYFALVAPLLSRGLIREFEAQESTSAIPVTAALRQTRQFLLLRLTAGLSLVAAASYLLHGWLTYLEWCNYGLPISMGATAGLLAVPLRALDYAAPVDRAVIVTLA